MTEIFMQSVPAVARVAFTMHFVIAVAWAQDSADINTDADAIAASSDITFARMPGDQARTELLYWLARSGASADVSERVTLAWSDDAALARLSGEELLDMLLAAFATVDSTTARLIEQSYGPGPVDSPVFDGIRESPIYRNQVELFRARWLVQHRYYDEALPLLERLSPEEVVDPAGLLFYRAVSEAQLLKRTDALDSLSLLLHSTLDVPDRFRTVAEMLKQDLESRKDDGMGRVAQLMQDVERRLDLGRSGEKTQEQEDAVVAAIDKLLEEMEEEKQRQNGGGGSGQKSASTPKGGSQPQLQGAPSEGIADRKNLNEKGKWGMLDQKAEANVRELIRGKFPSNFLDQIGRYTRKLADQKK